MIYELQPVKRNIDGKVLYREFLLRRQLDWLCYKDSDMQLLRYLSKNRASEKIGSAIGINLDSSLGYDYQEMEDLIPQVIEHNDVYFEWVEQDVLDDDERDMANFLSFMKTLHDIKVVIDDIPTGYPVEDKIKMLGFAPVALKIDGLYFQNAVGSEIYNLVSKLPVESQIVIERVETNDFFEKAKMYSQFTQGFLYEREFYFINISLLSK